MAIPILKIHEDAEREIAEARDLYIARSTDAAKRFLIELDRALEHVVANPLLSPTYMHGTRRYLLHDFPYLLVYDTRASVVRIFALAHTSRRPGYWRKRLRDLEET